MRRTGGWEAVTFLFLLKIKNEGRMSISYQVSLFPHVGSNLLQTKPICLLPSRILLALASFFPHLFMKIFDIFHRWKTFKLLNILTSLSD